MQKIAINPKNKKLAEKPSVSARYPNIVGAMAPVSVAPPNNNPNALPIPLELISLIMGGSTAAPRKKKKLKKI